MKNIIYDWLSSQKLSDWKLEGYGEISIADNGALMIRTFDCGPMRRATNTWLKNLELPENFQIEWDYCSESLIGNTMIIFNALPYNLNDLFEDDRIGAKYSDLASYRKMVCHTIGFHRGPYGGCSVLRKLGGDVPERWGEVMYGTKEWSEMDTITSLHKADEPLTIDDKGKVHHFKLVRCNKNIKFWVNDVLLHDYSDDLEYPYFQELLKYGKMGFRNFSGFADDYYNSIVIKSL